MPTEVCPTVGANGPSPPILPDPTAGMSVQSKINYWKRHKKKSNSRPDEEDLLVQLDGELMVMAARPAFQKQNNLCELKCMCPHILREDPVRRAVAKYLVKFLSRSKEQRDKLFMPWYRYASSGPRTHRGKQFYHLQFDATPSSNQAIVELQPMTDEMKKNIDQPPNLYLGIYGCV